MRHRSDETQAGIVKALRKSGCLVFCISQPCDLLVRRSGRYFLIDVSGVALYRKRDPRQLKKFEEWGVVLVATEEEALRAVGL